MTAIFWEAVNGQNDILRGINIALDLDIQRQTENCNSRLYTALTRMF